MQDVISQTSTSFDSLLGWYRSTSTGCNAGKKGLAEASQSFLTEKATLGCL